MSRPFILAKAFTRARATHEETAAALDAAVLAQRPSEPTDAPTGRGRYPLLNPARLPLLFLQQPWLRVLLLVAALVAALAAGWPAHVAVPGTV